MKTRPKSIDVAPPGLLVWRSYFDVDGTEQVLPPNVLVTSGLKSARPAHYALMCRADSDLILGDYGQFDPRAYRNVSEAGRPVGASQVTALLRKADDERDGSGYRINLRAILVRPCWVRLGTPYEVTGSKRNALLELLRNIENASTSDWMRTVLRARSEPIARRRKTGDQLALFAA